jgi:L-lactate utilization protein LutB
MDLEKEKQEMKDHDLLIKLNANMETIKNNLDKIWKKLDSQGDVRKDFADCKKSCVEKIKEHIDNHWKFAGLILTGAGIITAVIIKLLQ